MMKNIYFAGGCFWGVEKYFSLIQGVTETEVGYANGATENPTYESVCHENTGFAETVKVVYREDTANLRFLLGMYFDIVDPAAEFDKASQYRFGIYYTDPADLPLIQTALSELSQKIGKAVTIEAEPLKNFYSGEEYHQRYLEKNPNGFCHIGVEKYEKARAAKSNYTKEAAT
jgi:methionine-S-sulfoxide reductase